MSRTITEGYMPYLGYRTYYRMVGDTSLAGNRCPLLLLHGGPGSTHTYMEVLDDIADTGRLVISYDQLGCGNSYVDGHPELWKAQTWVDELKALRAYLHLDHIHLLGQSWGGMLAIQYLIEEKPRGVQSVILSSTLPASWLWSHEQHRRIRFLSEEDQAAVKKAERDGDYRTAACQLATAHFMERYCAGKPGPDAPECLKRPRRTGEESYLYAWGPNEFTPTGTLREFDYIDRLGEIHIPALIIDGTNDLCSPLIAKTMYDRIPHSRWELFDGARHMCFVEQNEHYEEILRPWLAEHDDPQKNSMDAAGQERKAFIYARVRNDH